MLTSSCLTGLITLLVFTLTVCAVALFVVGFKVVSPYQQTRHFSPEATFCSLVDVEMDGSVVCDCGGDEDYNCYSEYPCVKILVNYLEVNSGKVIRNASLYHSAFDYSALKEVGCFSRKCGPSEALNKLAVLELVMELGAVKDEFICYPALEHNSEALLEVIPHWKVLVGMLIPATPLALAAIGAMGCYLYNLCRH